MYTGFGFFHGMNISFGDVLRSINDFFAEQPGEAVIMRIRMAESPFKPTPDDLAQNIFNINRGQYPNLLYDRNINVGGTTLGQVRRRIVVLHSTFTGWNECHVEDEFEAMGEEKEASIRQGFEHFASNANNHLTITFSSSCGGIKPPYLHAREGLNRFVFNSAEAFN